MDKLRSLEMVERNGLISYWSKGPQNNYSSVKRVLGVVKFGPAELTHYQNLARKKGFNLTVGTVPAEVEKSVKPVPVVSQTIEPDLSGIIDKVNGVLKTVTAEWVVNCVTGRAINKREARFIGISSKDGLPYWIDRDASINDGPVAYPSVFGLNKPKPRSLDLVPRSLSTLVSGLR